MQQKSQFHKLECWLCKIRISGWNYW